MCLSLLEEEWDVAIILDACRYDSFKKLYKKYLPKGKLEKRLGASNTSEWLSNVFKKYHNDIVYVSGHPGINSIINSKHWCAKDKFFKIYDVWDIGWDEKLNTTKPVYVKKVALKAIKENKKKKVIVHFIQPHTPYRKAPTDMVWNKVNNVSTSKELSYHFRKYIGDLLQKSHLVTEYWKLRKLLRLKPRSLDEYYFFYFSIKELKNFYEDNLIWVLGCIKEFIESIKDKNKKIIVTSDHGEAFGERREYFHSYYNTTNPIIRMVPFFKIYR